MVQRSVKILAAPMAFVLGSTAMTSAAIAQSEEGFSWYGFLNGGVISVDDGTSTTTEVVDNSNAPSRLGFWFNNDLANGTIKFNFETALGLPGSSSRSQTSGGGDIEWSQENLRKVELIYQTDNVGTFYVGQGSMASDGITGGTDFSGTGLVGTVAVSDTFGGFEFLTGGVGSGVSIGDVFKDFDGGRKGRVRYDSPNFNGFVISAAAGQEILKDDNSDRFYDVALRYGTDFGDTSFKGTLAYAVNDLSSGETKTVIGSIGALHNPTGISGTLSVGENDQSGSYVYGKVGYQQQWFSFGKTYLSADVFRSQDMVSTGDEGVVWGLEAVQKVDSANVELFAAYRSHSYEQTGTNFSDVDGYMIGARWSF
ncbi:porin [Shimia sp.]|uniref:porin n=1 Tax=Shimia sp. TaxID=1954381 RepID=UPI003B8E1DE7